MPQFLYKIHATRPAMMSEGPTPQEAEIMGQHFDYVKDLTDKGIMLLVGRTQNPDASAFGIGIFEAENEEAAWMMVNNDPGVKNGVVKAGIISLSDRAGSKEVGKRLTIDD